MHKIKNIAEEEISIWGNLWTIRVEPIGEGHLTYGYLDPDTMEMVLDDTLTDEEAMSEIFRLAMVAFRLEIKAPGWDVIPAESVLNSICRQVNEIGGDIFG